MRYFELISSLDMATTDEEKCLAAGKRCFCMTLSLLEKDGVIILCDVGVGWK
jgi:hypothetical protein